MENFFKNPPLGGVVKDYCPKRRPIQVAARRINSRAKSPADLPFDRFVTVDQFAGRAIGIENQGAGKNGLQAITERGLAGGNSARNPNRRHPLFCRRRDPAETFVQQKSGRLRQAGVPTRRSAHQIGLFLDRTLLDDLHCNVLN